MKCVVQPGVNFTVELATEDREGAEPAQPNPAQQRARERAVLDLTDAAQAATRAAILLERGLAAESARLTLLAQQLYDQADNNRVDADQGVNRSVREVDPTPVARDALCRLQGHRHPLLWASSRFGRD